MATAATDTIETADPEDHTISPVEPAPMEEWFDRSSITLDAMVTIEGVTEEEWWRLAPEGRVCEFFDGVVYMPSPASEEHQLEVGFWHILLHGFCFRRQMGKVLLGPGVLALATGRKPEPDVFVVPEQAGADEPPAYLVVEVLSPSTRRHDLGRKAIAFQEAKIPEFVFVDLTNQKMKVHRQVGDTYQTETIEQGIWRSTALAGFWINVAWLWTKPLPDVFHCLNQILAGPPA